MGMRVPSGNAAAVTGQSSVAQWQQRTQQAQIAAVVNTPPPAPKAPAGTGLHVNLTA
jgi:nucleoid-associated protein YgaU